MSEIEIETIEDSNKSKTIGFFRVNKKKGLFYRQSDKVFSFEDHKLILEIKGEKYIITSDYPMSKMLKGGILLGFVHIPEGKKYGEMYPLPIGRNTFDDEQDLLINYTYESGDNAQQFVMIQDEGIQGLEEKLSSKLSLFSQELKRIQSREGLNAEFIQKIARSSSPDNAIPMSVNSAQKYKKRILFQQKDNETVLTKKELKKLQKKNKKYQQSIKKSTHDFFINQ